ncbi:hypothetical protein C8R47DRAFT_1196917 [Mycena vitilis]|nr:hypothetical protein C8R47DRAFT_1196917 [Mycena vitilis]
MARSWDSRRSSKTRGAPTVLRFAASIQLRIKAEPCVETSLFRGVGVTEWTGRSINVFLGAGSITPIPAGAIEKIHRLIQRQKTLRVMRVVWSWEGPGSGGSFEVGLCVFMAQKETFPVMAVREYPSAKPSKRAHVEAALSNHRTPCLPPNHQCAPAAMRRWGVYACPHPQACDHACRGAFRQKAMAFWLWYQGQSQAKTLASHGFWPGSDVF